MKRRGRPRMPGLLTTRELEVLALLREGLSNREIAERLGISLAGAKFHVSEIISKLGVTSREEAVQWQPRAGAFAPLLGLFRRPRLRFVVTSATVTLGLLVLVALFALETRPGAGDYAPGKVAVASTATPALEMAQPQPAILPKTIAEVQAMATFPVLEPALPEGFRVGPIVYYKLDFRCPVEVDINRCARVHNDFVQVNYDGPDGTSFILAQGYGGPAGGGGGHRFAPLKHRGVVDVLGREAHWVKGWPRSGMVDPGGGLPVQESDWNADSTVMLTWFASRDENPTGTDSPRCISLFSKTVDLDQLVAIARSLPLPALVPGRIDC